MTGVASAFPVEAPAGRRKRVHVIANPVAGRRSRHRLEVAVQHLEAQGAQVARFATRRRGDAQAMAREAAAECPDVVVAAGGDGTLNEVANGLAGSAVPLGVLPLGTANVFAREIRLPPDPLGAAATLLTGPARRLHLGRAGDRHFLQMAGVGFDAQVVYELNLGLKAALGKVAYVATGLRVLLSPPRHLLRLDADGEPLQGYGAILGKGRLYGGEFQATPRADPGRPDLDLCLFTRATPWSICRYAFGIAAGRHLDYPDVVYRKARRVRIESSRPLPVQADGDLVGRLPMDFSVAENALWVITTP